MKRFAYIIVALLFGFALGWFLRPSQEVVEVEHHIKTVYYERPTPIAVSTERRIVDVPRLLFAPADTVTIVQTVAVADNADSVTLDVAIEHREYRDSTYRAIVSGPVVGDLRPTLDFIETYNRTTTITVERPKRFAVTAGVGAAYTPKGFQPYVGVGVGVVIWRF
jgi:hypothetical protein|nr:MAG TPA: hypothetical protein [Caudoviricetes sp.]